MDEAERERIAGEASESPGAWTEYEAALEALRIAIPGDSVVVKREDLRKILSTGDGVCFWCPACDEPHYDGDTPEHDATCWIAAALGESAPDDRHANARKEQAGRVMPMIGNLLDMWDGLSRDQQDYTENFAGCMERLRKAVEA